MVNLDMKIQWGQIGIHYTPYQIGMDIKAPDIVLEKRDPELRLQVTFPYIVEIDQTVCFREIGLMNFMDAARQEAQKGQDNALQAIELYARKGDRLAHIEHKSVTVAQVAAEVPEQIKEVNIDMAPKSRPDITFQEGEIRGNLVYGDVNIRLDSGNTGYTFRYGKVDVFLEKEPFVKIIPTGLVFDKNA